MPPDLPQDRCVTTLLISRSTSLYLDDAFLIEIGLKLGRIARLFCCFWMSGFFAKNKKQKNIGGDRSLPLRCLSQLFLVEEKKINCLGC